MRQALFITRLAWEDAWRAKGRVVLLWAVAVLATFSSLVAVVVVRDYRTFSNELTSLVDDRATAFQVVYTEDWSLNAAWPGQPLDALLRQALTPAGRATSTFNYPFAIDYPIPVHFCLGLCPDYGQSGYGLLIGADVSGVRVGDTVDIGPYRETVVGRLPRGATLMMSMSPWATPTFLDDGMVLVTDYSHLADSLDPEHDGDRGFIFDNLLNSLQVRSWDEARISQLLTATAQSTGARLLPVQVTETDDVAAERTGALVMATWSAGLVGLALTTYFAVLGHVFRATWREPEPNTAGARPRPNRARLAVFAAILLAVPTAIAAAAWTLIPIPELATVRPWLAIPAAIMAITIWATCCNPPGTVHAP